MPATLEAPPAPAAAPVAPAPAAPPAPSGPPMRGQGKAKAAMFEELTKRSGAPTTEARPGNETPPAPAAPVEKPATPPAKVAPSTDDKPAVDPNVKPAATPVTEPSEEGIPKDAKNKSAWRLVDQWKARAKSLEQEVADAKTNALPEQERKNYLDRIEKTEARLKEYEDEIRHVNYEKSPEFKEKYDEPYKRQWELAMSDLSEIPVTLQDGSTRTMKADDLLTLVGMSLPQAQQVAQQAFGDFAGEVMQHRREIRKLQESRAKAIEDARTNGGQREKERMEMFSKHANETKEFVLKTWQQANEMASTHKDFGQYVTPREGDDEWNSRLEKGFALTDSALGFNPHDPKLNAQQRKQLIMKQAAIRHRSSAFGALTYDNQRLRAELAEAKASLEKFNGSTPPSAGGSSTPAPSEAPKGMAAIRASLEKIAK